MTEADGERPPRDPGLASERTALAWNRSGLAVVAAVVIMIRRLWPLHGAKSVVVLVVLAIGAALWAVGMVMSRRLGLRPGATGLLSTRAIRTLTVGTLILAIAGFLLGLLDLG